MNRASRRNYKKSRKAQSIYAVVYYADWCVREYKFAGEFEWSDYEEEFLPLVYHYDDHNGEFETWDVRPITRTTTGRIIGWTFNEERAHAVAYSQKILEKVNYGKTFND